MIFVGIDPGITGAVAFINAGHKHARALVFDLPRHAVDHRLCGFELARLVRQNVPADDVGTVFLEELHAVANHSGGGAGMQQMGSMMQSLGIIKGAIDCTRVPLHLVRPQKWKKFFDLTADKAESVDMARRLYPELAPDLLKSKDGRSEALLIAHYGLAQLHGVRIREEEIPF